MTTSQHQAFWNAEHSGQHKKLAFCVATHNLPRNIAWERNTAYVNAAKGAPSCQKVSRYTAKHNGSGFHRGMYIDTSRGCAKFGTPTAKKSV